MGGKKELCCIRQKYTAIEIIWYYFYCPTVHSFKDFVKRSQLVITTVGENIIATNKMRNNYAAINLIFPILR